eukprot:CAMPEP_0113879566 /NCGR_PEP_ID=MMETSP0780_2-20120614/7305_1 /TAXON_ID=652834 /ORGANISM="Palpitomonas bilix" /LENGTH=874 /DNA_ID=CAMNT_0000866153 /DNA_START=211 /DNA_END=2835 /DNA_ORIENTATION=+ /assembly_acc=CAM_ASM_000599
MVNNDSGSRSGNTPILKQKYYHADETTRLYKAIARFKLSKLLFCIVLAVFITLLGVAFSYGFGLEGQTVTGTLVVLIALFVVFVIRIVSYDSPFHLITEVFLYFVFLGFLTILVPQLADLQGDFGVRQQFKQCLLGRPFRSDPGVFFSTLSPSEYQTLSAEVVVEVGNAQYRLCEGGVPEEESDESEITFHDISTPDQVYAFLMGPGLEIATLPEGARSLEDVITARLNDEDEAWDDPVKGANAICLSRLHLPVGHPVVRQKRVLPYLCETASVGFELRESRDSRTVLPYVPETLQGFADPDGVFTQRCDPRTYTGSGRSQEEVEVLAIERNAYAKECFDDAAMRVLKGATQANVYAAIADGSFFADSCTTAYTPRFENRGYLPDALIGDESVGVWARNVSHLISNLGKFNTNFRYTRGQHSYEGRPDADVLGRMTCIRSDSAFLYRDSTPTNTSSMNTVQVLLAEALRKRVTVSTSYHNYGNGGFEFLLDESNAKATMAHIAQLREAYWIDENTRVINIDYQFMSRSSNKRTFVRLTFDMLPTGDVHPSYFIFTTSTDLLTNAIVVHVYLALFVLSLYLLAEEVARGVRKGKKTFSSPWFYIDLMNLGMFIIGFSFFTTFARSPETIDKAQGVFLFRNMIAINCWVSWTKVLKYTNDIPILNELTAALGRSAWDVFFFALIIGVIMWGFSEAFFVILGADIGSFQDLSSTMITVLRAMLSDIGVIDDLVDGTPDVYLGAILFLLYCVIMVFFLLTMFVAIISDYYLRVKEEMEREKFRGRPSMKEAWRALCCGCRQRRAASVVKVRPDNGGGVSNGTGQAYDESFDKEERTPPKVSAESSSQRDKRVDTNLDTLEKEMKAMRLLLKLKALQSR